MTLLCVVKLLVWRGAATAAAADDIVAAISAICSLQQMEQWNTGTTALYI